MRNGSYIATAEICLENKFRELTHFRGKLTD